MRKIQNQMFKYIDVDDEDKVIKRLELKNHLKLLESLWDNDSLGNLKLLKVLCRFFVSLITGNV